VNVWLAALATALVVSPVMVFVGAVLGSRRRAELDAANRQLAALARSKGATDAEVAACSDGPA
jgi:hypothetical protein